MIVIICRQAKVLLGHGRELDVVLREIGARNTFYRWRKEYGGLKRAVAELTVGNQIRY